MKATMLVFWIGAYFVIGVVLAVIAGRRGTAIGQAVLVVPLWPLLAPFFIGGTSERTWPAPPHLGEAELAALTPGERDAVSRFQKHLASRLEQLEALRKLRAQSNGRITDRLDLVEAELKRDLDGGRALLEELADRVALAQVASLGVHVAQGADRLRLEALIARADALVQETTQSPPN